jgi:Heparinase II/III N-terminus/Heparinase II/III-like protein
MSVKQPDESRREFIDAVFVALKRVQFNLTRQIYFPLLSASLIKLNAPKMSITSNGQDLSTLSIKELYSLCPNRIENLFVKLDLDKKGLETVKKAVTIKDFPAACEALITYYKEAETVTWLRNKTLTMSVSCQDLADAILNDTFTFQLVTGRVPRHDSGLLDWSYLGPQNDKEWGWFLNRHYHLLHLYVAYQKTGNLSYVHCINNHVIDWVLSNPCKTNPQIWDTWRGLEVAFRVMHWATVFYALQQVTEFSDASRILMLSSISEHASCLRYMHTWRPNLLIKEMNGLATAALCWTEFKDANKWFKYASSRLINQSKQQVYPDGVHKELTSHYHLSTLQNFEKFAQLLSASGYNISLELKDRLECMWNYLAYSMRPDGHSLLNNDSDRDYNRPLVSEAATAYQRPDWIYIATNGFSGKKPKGEPSKFFPWAGQMIMRSGWDDSAHWAVFDIGPLGTNYHIHHDKLHLSIAAYGRDLLVDSGRFRYVRDRFWAYFRESASHNVILIDGKGQKNDTKQLHSPIIKNSAIAPEFDFAKGTFNGGFRDIQGKAAHSRAVIYLRGKYWVVIDRIFTNKPRIIEAIWHFHPDCTVTVQGQSVGSIDADVGNLKIFPISNFSWTVDIVKGQESPMQGWWSREYNHITPSPTAIYSTEIAASTTFAWVLAPAKGKIPKISVKILPSPKASIFFTVKIDGELEEKIAVRMSGDEVINLGDGLELNGDCAILRIGKKPLVALGCISDIDDNIIAISNDIT